MSGRHLQPLERRQIAEDGGYRDDGEQRQQAGQRPQPPPEQAGHECQRGGESKAPRCREIVDKMATQQGFDGLRLDLGTDHQRCLEKSATVGGEVGVVHAAVAGAENDHFAFDGLNSRVAQCIRRKRIAHRQRRHRAGRAGEGQGQALACLDRPAAKLPLIGGRRLAAGMHREQEGERQQARIVSFQLQRRIRVDAAQRTVVVGDDIGGADEALGIEIGERHQVTLRRQQGFFGGLHTGEHQLAGGESLAEIEIKAACRGTAGTAEAGEPFFRAGAEEEVESDDRGAGLAQRARCLCVARAPEEQRLVRISAERRLIHFDQHDMLDRMALAGIAQPKVTIEAFGSVEQAFLPQGFADQQRDQCNQQGAQQTAGGAGRSVGHVRSLLHPCSVRGRVE